MAAGSALRPRAAYLGAVKPIKYLANWTKVFWHGQAPLSFLAMRKTVAPASITAQPASLQHLVRRQHARTCNDRMGVALRRAGNSRRANDDVIFHFQIICEAKTSRRQCKSHGKAKSTKSRMILKRN